MPPSTELKMKAICSLSERWYSLTCPHVVTTQKTTIDMFPAVRTSHPVLSVSFFTFSAIRFILFLTVSVYPVLSVCAVKASNVKLQVWLPVVSNDDCGRVYQEKRVDIGSGQLCAGGVQGKDSCTGDSGGPLMSTGTSSRDGRTRYFVAGVVSYGPEPCGKKDWPGVYTRVASYTDWILNQLAD
jgi:hypothetical protein